MNARHQQFINEYLKCWNQTEAYRRVYPNSSYEAARRSASDLLTIPDISEAIHQRITENAMSADEVLARLAEHARGDMGDFINVSNGSPSIDFSTIAEQGKTRLIRRLRTKTKSYVIKGDDEDGTPVTEVDIDFELYDAQAALEKLGRHHKLFTDKVEHDLTDKAVDSAAALIAALQRGAETNADS